MQKKTRNRRAARNHRPTQIVAIMAQREALRDYIHLVRN